MRCVLVNDANLKNETYCAFCRKKIRDNYAREISTRFLYCDFDCYRRAAAMPSPILNEQLPPAHPGTFNFWTRSS